MESLVRSFGTKIEYLFSATTILISVVRKKKDDFTDGEARRCLLENDFLVTDPQRIAEIMNEIFLSIDKQQLTDHMNISCDPYSSINHIIEKHKTHDSTVNSKRNLKE